jgi:HD-like signal output (HDOD) protein
MTELSRQDAEALVASIGIPPRPAVVLTVMDEKAKDAPDMRVIVAAISGDVGVAAALLKAINSPLFGLRSPVQSILQAVSLLGMNRVSTLVNSLALKTTLNAQGIERFWDQSARTAMVSAWLARKLGQDVDSAHLFGLFRDAGMPLLMKRFHDYKETLNSANTSLDLLFTEIEDHRHGTNHAVIGAILARNWHLPTVIHDAILRHHDPDVFHGDSNSSVKNLIALAHLAGQIESMHSRNIDDNEWLRFSKPVMTWLMLDNTDVGELTEETATLLLESGN